jgi:hypothetical protein
MSFADNLNALPKVGNIRSIELSTAQGAVVATIENRPGQAGSVAVYSYLIGEYGCIDGRAAVKGLELYAEHTADARAHPGKHPNIDRLLAIEGGDAALLGKFNYVGVSAQ